MNNNEVAKLLERQLILLSDVCKENRDELHDLPRMTRGR